MLYPITVYLLESMNSWTVLCMNFKTFLTCNMQFKVSGRVQISNWFIFPQISKFSNASCEPQEPAHKISGKQLWAFYKLFFPQHKAEYAEWVFPLKHIGAAECSLSPVNLLVHSPFQTNRKTYPGLSLKAEIKCKALLTSNLRWWGHNIFRWRLAFHKPIPHSTKCFCCC